MKNNTATGAPTSAAMAPNGLRRLRAAMTAAMTVVTAAAGTPTSSNSCLTRSRYAGSSFSVVGVTAFMFFQFAITVIQPMSKFTDTVDYTVTVGANFF